MELNQIQVFVAVATELHFGRAAKKLYMGQATVSELIRRLEHEVGTQLFTRTTRQVSLTAAGAELLERARVILNEVAAARAAVRRVANGDQGVVRLGVTPPVWPVLAPYLVRKFKSAVPDATLSIERMWLPNLLDGVTDGTVDVAITCGRLNNAPGQITVEPWAEPLLVAVRPENPAAELQTVHVADLERCVLGVSQAGLFPAWARAQRQILDEAGIKPRTSPLDEVDLAATHWMQQREVDWIMLTPSLARQHPRETLRRLSPEFHVPFTLRWNPRRAVTPLVERFVDTALSIAPPAGWVALPTPGSVAEAV